MTRKLCRAVCVAIVGVVIGFVLGGKPLAAGCTDVYVGECQSMMSYWNDCVCDDHGCGTQGPPYYVCWYRQCTGITAISSFCGTSWTGDVMRKVCAPYNQSAYVGDCPCVSSLWCSL
jgi:hypothetical protein